MRDVTYTLLPDVTGRRFEERVRPLHLFLHEAGILIHRQIPPCHVLNALLARGYCPRTAEWNPIEVTSDEYDEVVEALLANPEERFTRLEPDRIVSTPEEWEQWLQSIGLA